MKKVTRYECIYFDWSKLVKNKVIFFTVPHCGLVGNYGLVPVHRLGVGNPWGTVLFSAVEWNHDSHSFKLVKCCCAALFYFFAMFKNEKPRIWGQIISLEIITFWWKSIKIKHRGNICDCCQSVCYCATQSENFTSALLHPLPLLYFSPFDSSPPGLHRPVVLPFPALSAPPTVY